MSANLVSDRPAAISILRILAMIVFGYLIMGNVVAILVISLLFDGNLIEAVGDPLNHPEIRDIMLFAQGLASLVGLVFIPWFYLRSFEHRSFARFFSGIPSALWFPVLSALVIAFAISISPIVEWNAALQFPEWTGALGQYLANMEKQAEILVRAFTSNLTPATFTLVFVVIAIIPAIGEEFVFRGLIQTELQRAFGNPHVAIWLAAAFFSAFHFQFLGFFPRMLIGALLGYVYFWSGNLWLPIVVHFLNNGLQVIALYLKQLGVITLDLESPESAPMPYVALALAITGALIYYCKKNLGTKNESLRDSIQ